LLTERDIAAITAAPQRKPIAAATTPATLALLAVLVFVSVLGCIELTANFDRIATIWVANAIQLAFVIKRKRADWAKILTTGYIANAAANYASGDPLFNVGVIPLINLIEVLLVAVPMRLRQTDRTFARPKSLLVFYALALGPATILPAIMAAAYFHTYGAHFVQTAISWYTADALGLAIVVPPLLTVTRSALKEMFGREQIGATLVFIGVVLGVAALNYWQRTVPVAFLFFPAVFLLTFQRGFAGGAIGLAITALYMIVPVVAGDPSIALKIHSLREQMMVVQIFVAVTGLSVTMTGAALEERQRLTRRLAAAITTAETAREEAIVARDAAVQASRSKSMFLANMSHELRTPLNAVIGFADLMHSEVFGPLGNNHYREYATHIQGAGQHLLELINDILDMSKIEAGKMELEHSDFAIDAKIRECIDLMQERATAATVSLVADLPPGSLPVHADSRALRQILLNLLSNAIKFTPAGGRIVTKARITNGKLILSVSDTGIGIPPERIEDLGNPFVQLRNNAGETHQGTGLGLALVRSLTELHQGTMRIVSTEGHGTTVAIEIPAQPNIAREAA
jgi:signal transduction histidine kinase